MIDRLALKKAKELDEKKANREQEDWIRPTLLNGWKSRVSSAYPLVSYYKDDFGIVHLKGTTVDGEEKLMFTLPEGYRPEDRYNLFATPDTYADSTNLFAIINVKSDGSVEVSNASLNRITLNNISFRAVGP